MCCKQRRNIAIDAPETRENDDQKKQKTSPNGKDRQQIGVA